MSLSKRQLNKKINNQVELSFNIIDDASLSMQDDEFKDVFNTDDDNGFSDTNGVDDFDTFPSSTCEDSVSENLNNISNELTLDETHYDEFLEIKGNGFKTSLISWALKHNISHNALNELLAILKEHPCHSDLPKDSRTLLHTPRHTNLIDVSPGKYCHFSLVKGIQDTFLGFKESIDSSLNDIRLFINIDGLPISKSSNNQLWPILGYISTIPDSNPFLIGCYQGNSKPSSVNEFLKSFVNESLEVLENGINFDNKRIGVHFGGFICDAPARAFILCTKGHNAYFGCSKCQQEGEYINNRMAFPENSAVLRTDKDFLEQTQKDHHTGVSPLTVLPVGLVSQVPYEYMHLVCLGVMRKLLILWLRGNLLFRLNSSKVAEISNKLEALKTYMSCDFVRKPRALKEIDRWKATEFRQFLLYTGPVVLKNILNTKFYNNFMSLHVAISILVNPQLCFIYNEYASSLLNHFVSTFEILYGTEYISYNVHGLIHLAADVKQFGALDVFSSFRFENYLQNIKKKLRKSEKALAQLYCRLNENTCITQTKFNHKKYPMCEIRHNNGPLVQNCADPQYKQIIFEKYLLKTSSGNNCCLLNDNTIVVIENIATRKNEIVIIGRRFLQTDHFFKIPCNSELINVFMVSTLSEIFCWPIDMIQKKCLLLPSLNNKETSVIYPLLHTHKSLQ